MLTVEELLSKSNVNNALYSLSHKNDNNRSKDMSLTDLRQYWDHNQDILRKQIIDGTYKPGIVKEKEIINGKGKRRKISVLSSLDRFITRLLSQKLKKYIEPIFLPCSFAFQQNKGIQSAVEQCRIYLNSGCDYVVSIDIQDFFDNIKHSRMMELIQQHIKDKRILRLIESYISCDVQIDNRIQKKTIGLVQGNSISPILSNLYLHGLDKMMEDKGYCWVRFADDINIYASGLKQANEILDDVINEVRKLGLDINQSKTGIFNPLDEIYLGYDFYKSDDGIEIKKHIYKKTSYYKNWHDSAIEKINHQYHLVKQGVLNKKDFSLLFENDKEQYHIPVEVAEQLNVYSEVVISSGALNFLAQQGIRIAFLNKHGLPMGYFIPNNSLKSGQTLINQFSKYLNNHERLLTAKKIEISGFHNIRTNLKYYHKKKRDDFTKEIEKISEFIKQANDTRNTEELMLLEARCRQMYYVCFNKIIKNRNFEYDKRTRNPPNDAINALISFLNTLLYNELIYIISKTTLDLRVGIIHSITRRKFTLNLDFADLFKPIIVDRVIFSLINTNQLKADRHFEERDSGVFLNEDGKRIVITKFEEKMNDHVIIEDKFYTYRQVMEREVWKYMNYVNNNIKYKPYKYY